MENKYAVVKVIADGVNPEVYMFKDKEKARERLKRLWNKTLEEMAEDYGEPIEAETWRDSEGDYAKITFTEDDWIYYQVVEVKEG